MINRTELEERYAETDIVLRSSSDQRQRAVDTAGQEMNSYFLAAGLTTPLITASEQLKTYAGAIAAYWVAVWTQLLPEPVASSSYYLERKAALDWLNALVAGKVALDSQPPIDVASGPLVASEESRGW